MRFFYRADSRQTSLISSVFRADIGCVFRTSTCFPGGRSLTVRWSEHGGKASTQASVFQPENEISMLALFAEGKERLLVVAGLAVGHR